jgi:YD repeat-containing protein
MPTTPIHRRYQYDPAGELVRTLDKLRGEIKYEYEANGQLCSRDTGSLVGSEEFRYDAAANRLDFNARQFDKVKDNRIKQWRDQEYRYDPWGNLIEKRSGHSKLQNTLPMTARTGWLKLKRMSVAGWRAPGSTGMTAWDGGWPSRRKSTAKSSTSAFSGKG